MAVVDLAADRRMLARLRLQTVPQHATGRLVFEDTAGAIRRDLDFATVGGALRIEGGLARVTDALARELGESLRLACPVCGVTDDATGVTVLTAHDTIRADRVVLAWPSRPSLRLGWASSSPTCSRGWPATPSWWQPT